jgi:hypothetical protein
MKHRWLEPPPPYPPFVPNPALADAESKVGELAAPHDEDSPRSSEADRTEKKGRKEETVS